MCDPVTLGLVSFATGAAQSVASYVAQNQESKATQAAAEQSWRDQQTQITQRHMQEEDALKQKKTQQNIEEARARAEVEVSGAASGVEGISLDNLMSDVSRRAATNRQTEETNTAMVLSQLRQQRKSVTSEAVGRINSAPRASPLQLIAGIGSAGVSGYNNYLSAKSKL